MDAIMLPLLAGREASSSVGARSTRDRTERTIAFLSRNAIWPSKAHLDVAPTARHCECRFNQWVAGTSASR